MTPIKWSMLRDGVLKWALTSLIASIIGSAATIYANRLVKAEQAGEQNAVLQQVVKDQASLSNRLTSDENEFRTHTKQDTVKDEHNRNLEKQNDLLIKRVDHMTEVFERWLLGQRYKGSSKNEIDVTPPAMSSKEISKALAGIRKPGEFICQRGKTEAQSH